MQAYQQPNFVIKFQFVKAILLSTLTIATTAFATIANSQTTSQSSQSTIQFYCGTAKDPSSRSVLPATVAKISGYQEEPVLIIWKSEAFGKMNPQKRCETVSPKFQAVLQQGRNYITAGVDRKSGLGIICAVANAEQTCDRENMLFTLKSYQDAGTTVRQISDLFAGKTNIPIYQSSSGKQVVDLLNFSLLMKK
ncbi:COP23 domain-containing protein [Chamaesiphon polymorphus]|uniref:Uncharacterized protein n=1 Tax=Chamaesiphon polymorphus CCALA 037 TaxID=2107692 RepID=A0A2T1F623_9CYAN|nr:COP23 domain-containing protein [Chamaesiphon polymorphus]PSB40442.1 hypothetical protein C7B77_28340 [Chamaesiphon polymorphus CCALA 037]